MNMNDLYKVLCDNLVNKCINKVSFNSSENTLIFTLSNTNNSDLETFNLEINKDVKILLNHGNIIEKRFWTGQYVTEIIQNLFTDGNTINRDFTIKTVNNNPIFAINTKYKKETMTNPFKIKITDSEKLETERRKKDIIKHYFYNLRGKKPIPILINPSMKITGYHVDVDNNLTLEVLEIEGDCERVWFSLNDFRPSEIGIIIDCIRNSEKPSNEGKEKAYTTQEWEDIKSRLIKPKIGIKPRFIWLEERFKDLNETIDRKLKANESINLEWVEEYNNLQKELIKSE